jgi:pyruvate dehydrogenase E2 component (dihydrolipoamide acetyltransferase)
MRVGGIMPREFKLPDLGEGIHEGEVIEVLVSVGDKVIDGMPVLVIETDKATTEIPAPVTGVVREIRVKPGDVVKVGEVLMVFFEEGQAEMPRKGDQRGEGERPVETPLPSAAAEPRRVSAPAETTFGKAAGPVPAAPSTRRLARELGVDLHLVPPSGAGGRVTPEDVRKFAGGLEHTVPPPSSGVPVLAKPALPPVEPSTPTPRAPSLPDFGRWGRITREPLRSVRRATARHMALAWAQIPHVTHQDVVDITELEALRRHHKKEIQAQKGVLSLTVFAMKAAVAALKAHPRFNASLDGNSEEIILKHYYHIGVAVDTERGLIVPVIRDVDRKSITQLAMELNDLVVRGRAGKIEREEMIGGTFTITNIGVLGGTAFTPIVNHPEVAILGMARASLQPVVTGDEDDPEILPRLMLPLILGFDHRVVDGADAARFLGMIMDTLGDPEKLLMMI